MKTIHFNTGRKYSAHGQRITATLHDDGVVTFHDHDRMVDGEFYHSVPDTGATLTERDVLRVYDACKAPNTKRSWQDAFLTGGCNTKFQG